MKLFLASGNAHKAAELQALADSSPLPASGLQVSRLHESETVRSGVAASVSEQNPLAHARGYESRNLGVATPGVEIVSARAVGGMPEVEEDTGTFVGNARKKAVALRSKLPADAWALADDSGLCVDALGGGPGVESAYFAGPQGDGAANLAKLVTVMRDVPESARGAKFVCVLLLLGPGGEEKVFVGECAGRLAREPKGGAGFGYDPLFVPEGHAVSFAELGDAVKAGISHRARAWAKLAEWVQRRG